MFVTKLLAGMVGAFSGAVVGVSFYVGMLGLFLRIAEPNGTRMSSDLMAGRAFYWAVMLFALLGAMLGSSAFLLMLNSAQTRGYKLRVNPRRREKPGFPPRNGESSTEQH